MSLIICKECKYEVSEYAQACPKCGAPVSNASAVEQVTLSTRKEPEVDDRVSCPKCGKKIVPKIVTVNDVIDRTVCPFCIETIEDHSLLGLFFNIIGYAIVGIVFIAGIVFVVATEYPVAFILSLLGLLLLGILF